MKWVGGQVAFSYSPSLHSAAALLNAEHTEKILRAAERFKMLLMGLLREFSIRPGRRDDYWDSKL